MTEASQALTDDRPAPPREGSAMRLGIFIGGFVAMVAILVVLWQLTGQGPVNPNTATRDQLMTLPEVGPETADRILALRPFLDEADFTQRVAGLSANALAEMRSRLDFDGDGRGDCCVH